VLFDRLFHGDPDVGRLSTLIDQIASGETWQPSAADRRLLSEWRRELSELAGIEQRQGVEEYACIDHVRLDAFNARKNRARAEVHRKLETSLREHLVSLLDRPAPTPETLEHARALGTLRRFQTESALPAAPLLSGLRTALRYQLSTPDRIQWVFDEAALLNLGHDRLAAAISLLREVGMWLSPPSALLENGGLQRTQRCWALIAGAWTRAQARALANAIGANHSVAPTGRIVSSGLERDERAILKPGSLCERWCVLM
jgi:hypothetical protein